MSKASLGRRRGRPKGSTRYAHADGIALARIADLLVATSSLSAVEAINQVTGRPHDTSLIYRLRRKLRAQRAALLAAAVARRHQSAPSQSQREADSMPDIFSSVAIPLAGGVASAIAGASAAHILSRRQRKADRTPLLRFGFSDRCEHEGLGAVGFRHLQSKLELLIGGNLQNIGLASAMDIKLDIFHFLSRKGPVHEIRAIPVAEVLRPGESVRWIRSIGLADITVDDPRGYYQSGPTGVFRDNTNSQYYHFHVVFSCRNMRGDACSAIYCMEQIVENASFKGNRMMFMQQVGKYRPQAQFRAEWRREIKERELYLQRSLAVAPANPYGPHGFHVGIPGSFSSWTECISLP